MNKLTKTEILDSLIAEGLGETREEILFMLEDMGMSWQDVRDGKWF